MQQLRALAPLALKRLGASARESLYRTSRIDCTKPSHIRALLTYRCNYRCEYCWHWRWEKQEEMGAEDWRRALWSLKEYIGPYVVNFVGGEPFIYRHFLDLIDFCRGNGIGWGVITNGSALTEKTIARVVDCNPIYFDVSVDGTTSEIHDRARGVAGSLDRVSRGIRMLVQRRNESGRGFPIRIKPTVHRYNRGNLTQLVDWAAQIGATSIDFSPVSLKDSPERDRLYLGDAGEIAALQQTVFELVRRKRRGDLIETSEGKLLALVAHFENKAVNYGTRDCRNGLRGYWIGPNGDVESCFCFHQPIGNVKSSSAREIWQGGQARACRNLTLTCRPMDPSVDHGCGPRRSLLEDVQRAFVLFGRRRRDVSTPSQ